MTCDCNIMFIFNAYHNKRDLNIIENINIIKKLMSLKNNVTKIGPFYNVTSIQNSHVSTISIIQLNSDVIIKRNHLSK